MFFTVSKLFWLVAAPTNLLILLACMASLALFTRFRVAARRVLVAVALLLFACGIGPLGSLLILPLENRFPRASVEPAEITGIIVLGGATDERITLARDQVTLTEWGARLSEAVNAAKRFPDARFLFTGGSGVLAGHPGMSEAQVAKRFFIEMGVPAARIELEDRSRNTWQNAVFTRDILHPAAGQRWLLVTSAAHMPRSMGIFRKLGFDVRAWPSGYRTTGQLADALANWGEASLGLRLTDSAIREWIGLVAYRLGLPRHD
jgi:uncharacterized SAM-binding protein YcdF (DUF218 family)